MSHKLRYTQPELQLPIDLDLKKIGELLQQHQNLVVTAAPGAGKTTRLPAYLAAQFSKKVLCLEPRRMAAVAAAHRIAEEQNWKMGYEIGYQVRFANETSAGTSLIFLTEALLTKRLLNSADLDDVDVIILDEFHERSLHVDLALGLIRELQLMGHPIKLVVMSATLAAEKISEYLGEAPIVSVPGKLFELTIHHQKSPQIIQTHDAFYENILSHLKLALKNASTKDILIFLPGAGEIERLSRKLEEASLIRDRELVKLYGQLSLEEHRRALQKSSGQRIVLSTNIAESSVTLDGVNTVIDSGVAKFMRWDQRTGFARLDLGRISLSSAKQRAGRSARQYPGVCYKLWSVQDELSMSVDEISEIQRAELSESVLFLAAQGVTDFKNFLWYEKPPEKNLQSALQFLNQIKALNPSGQITELGQRLLSWPLPPRESFLLENAIELNIGELGAELGAILQEKDFFLSGVHGEIVGDSWESDLLPRIEFLRGDLQISQRNFSRSSLEITKKSARQLLGAVEKYNSQKKNKSTVEPKNTSLHKSNSDENKIGSSSSQNEYDLISKLLLKTYPDRLCRRRSSESPKGLMVGGRGVTLHQDSLVKKSEFYLALRGVDSQAGNETMVSLSHGFTKDFILENFKEKIQLQKKLKFFEEKMSFMSEESRYFEDLALDIPTLKTPTADDVSEKFPDWCVENIDWLLKHQENFQKWMKRWVYFTEQQEFHRINTTHFQIEACWKNIFSGITLGETQVKEILKKDFIYFIEQEVPSELLQHFKKNYPEKIQVPSGNHLPIQYTNEQGPAIEVRLQEVFGWHESPVIAHRKLTFFLLGPNYRAVQVTQDLSSFWKNTYPEIRKELKIKYPKHSWPEDPWNAPAQAKGPSIKRY